MPCAPSFGATGPRGSPQRWAGSSTRARVAENLASSPRKVNCAVSLGPCIVLIRPRTSGGFKMTKFITYHVPDMAGFKVLALGSGAGTPAPDPLPPPLPPLSPAAQAIRCVGRRGHQGPVSARCRARTVTPPPTDRLLPDISRNSRAFASDTPTRGSHGFRTC